jgi:hypothetical protein
VPRSSSEASFWFFRFGGGAGFDDLSILLLEVDNLNYGFHLGAGDNGNVWGIVNKGLQID